MMVFDIVDYTSDYDHDNDHDDRSHFPLTPLKHTKPSSYPPRSVKKCPS